MTPKFNIYKITNLINGRTYIGKTKMRLDIRCGKHRRQLRNSTHVNTEMLTDWKAGQFKMCYELVMTVRGEEKARAKETELMNLEVNPYNIRKGNKGDMLGKMGVRSRSFRIYMQDEVKKLAGCSGYNTRRLMEIFNISQPLVSMILNGHRTAPAPNTTFGQIISDHTVTLFTQSAQTAENFNLYSEAAC